MSANNYILIKWTKNGYSISERNSDDGSFISQINPLIKRSKNLEEAVRRANQYQSPDWNYIVTCTSNVPVMLWLGIAEI